MNIYIVLEGETAARKLYKSWIPLVNPNLNYVDYINDSTAKRSATLLNCEKV